ncbi:MAG TPA: hypothetical protein VE709_15565 [Pseudonocardiaceae bacterium]|nr:hypothetical protein [Pseudonocardiaceae bacterium]
MAVPGIGSTTGERSSSHASETCAAVAPELDCHGGDLGRRT